MLPVDAEIELPTLKRQKKHKQPPFPQLIFDSQNLRFAITNLRATGCVRKKPYDRYEKAEWGARGIRHITRGKVEVYKCVFCGFYHVGHVVGHKKQKILVWLALLGTLESILRKREIHDGNRDQSPRRQR